MDEFIQIVPARPMASPCVNVCTIDPATARCRGCARTRDEIARWTRMSDAERDAIMAALPARRAG